MSNSSELLVNTTTITNPVILLMRIAKEENGLSALFSGTLPRIVRAAMSGAVQFVTYELTQNALVGK